MRLKKFCSFFVIGAILVLFRVVFAQPPNLYTFSGDVEITDAPPDDGDAGGISSGQHFVASRGDTVYVVWQESRGHTPPLGTHIFLAKSTDGGQSFGPSVGIALGGNPSMKMDDNGVIYIAYQVGDIYFIKSTDGGNTFTSRVNVVDSAGIPFGQEHPSIAVNGKGQIFVAWIDKRLSPQSIFVAASFDSGESFMANVQASDNGFYAYSTDLAVDDSGRVFVVWPEFVSAKNLPLRLARSDDSGQTFSYRVTVSDLPVDTGQVYALNPSISMGRGVGVVWEDSRSNRYSLRFSVSQNHGQTFPPSVVVDTGSGVQAPSLVWKNGIFYAAWRCYHPRPPGTTLLNLICFSYSADGGQTFAPPVDALAAKPNLSPFDLHFMGSLTVNEKGRAYVTWFDDRYDPSFDELFHLFGAWGTATTIKGDLNLDGLATVLDVVMELNAAFLGQSFSAPFESADSNCDGQLTAADVVLLANSVFLENPFPCNLSLNQ